MLSKETVASIDRLGARTKADLRQVSKSCTLELELELELEPKFTLPFKPFAPFRHWQLEKSCPVLHLPGRKLGARGIMAFVIYKRLERRLAAGGCAEGEAG